MFLLESYETKTSTLPGVYVLQNNRIDNFAKLIKVVLQLLICKLEIETTHEYFRRRVTKLYVRLTILSSISRLLNRNIRVRFLNYLSSDCRRCLTSYIRWKLFVPDPLLIVVSRFYVNTLSLNHVTRVLVHI